MSPHSKLKIKFACISYFRRQIYGLNNLEYLLGPAAVFTLFRAILIKDKWSRILNLAFVLSVVLLLLPYRPTKIDGVNLFIICCGGVLLYAFSNSNFDSAKKWTLAYFSFTSGIAFMLLRSGPNNWVELLNYTGILNFALFGYIIISKRDKYMREIGFLTVLTTEAMIRFISALGAAH